MYTPMGMTCSRSRKAVPRSQLRELQSRPAAVLDGRNFDMFVT